MQATDREDLIDQEDGENRAVRSFLMQYSCDRSITVGAMLAHMNRSGWRGTAPAFALEVRPETHLTKGGAQLWIRHLISLEVAAPAVNGCKTSDEQAGRVAAKDEQDQSLTASHPAPEQQQVAAHSAQPAADPAPTDAGIPISDKRGAFDSFMLWADQNLGQGYSLEREDGTFLDPVTRWAFKAWQARGQQQAGVADEVAGVDIKRLLRNLEDTSYNEGSEALACRLTDCRAVIKALLSVPGEA